MSTPNKPASNAGQQQQNDQQPVRQNTNTGKPGQEQERPESEEEENTDEEENTNEESTRRPGDDTQKDGRDLQDIE